MSDFNYYQPHIYIDGKKLPESADLHGLTPVADFKLKWGAPDWYSDVDGTTLTLTLLDPLGTFMNFGDLQNKRITITRDPDNSKVFEGTIDEVSAEHGRAVDPRRGKPRTIWRYDITAYDHLGTLARDRRRGITYPDRENPAEPRLHWGPCTMRERKADLDIRTSAPIDWVPAPIDEWDDEPVFYFFPVAAYERQQVVSALTVLRQTARISNPFARPHYNPTTGHVEFLIPASVDQSVLSNTGFGEWYIELGSPSGRCKVLTEPWEAVSGIGGATTALEQATQVELIMRYEDYQRDQDPPYSQMVEGSGEVLVAVPSDTSNISQMTIRIETDLAWTFNFYPFQIGYPVWSLLDPTYGRVTPRDVEYRFDKHGPAPAGYESFLIPHPPTEQLTGYTGPPRYEAFYFAPSLLNTLHGSGPVCFVGGELSYSSKRGWRALMHPAPAPQSSDRPTLGETTAEAALGWTYDESTVADWQHITHEPTN